jgi:hypothetical protein
MWFNTLKMGKWEIESDVVQHHSTAANGEGKETISFY